MEKIDGDTLFHFVDQLIKRQVELPSAYCKALFRGLLDCVEYIHRKEVCHRDIKLDNIMLRKDGKVVLIDFGFADKTVPKKRWNDSLGSVYFKPPEVINKDYDAKEADIYTCGLILFTMYFRRYAWDIVKGEEKLSYEQRSKPYSYPLGAGKAEKFWEGHKPPKSDNAGLLKDLLEKMLSFDPASRLSIYQIKEHPWFKQTPEATQQEVADIRNQLLQKAIEQKISFANGKGARSGSHNAIYNSFLNSIRVDSTDFEAKTELQLGDVIYEGTPEAVVAGVKFMLEADNPEAILPQTTWERYTVQQGKDQSIVEIQC